MVSQIDGFRDSIMGVAHVDIDSLEEFMEEMRVARTSSYYSDERQAKYRSLNMVQVNNFLQRSNSVGGSMRVSSVVGKLLRLSNITTSSYF